MKKDIETHYPRPEFFNNIPKQHQDNHPGIEKDMDPKPIFTHDLYQKKTLKLEDKVAIITGGDSGIGRAIAVSYAKEGCHVVIVYYNEDTDASDTKDCVLSHDVKCLLIKGDISTKTFCQEVIDQTLKEFKHVDILVNNAAVQYPKNEITEIDENQLEKTFKVNFFGAFYLIQSIMPHLKAGDCIINTTSIVAYQGHDTLIDYASTKGALTTLTRSLVKPLAKKGIRINAVAPGPIWTPLIPSSFDAKQVSTFGESTPMGRCGQPVECAGAYVYLASDDASYISGQTIHINGGEVING